MLLDANPIIAAGGQIAAIIICIFFLITIVLMLAVNLGLAFVLAWIREKVNAIKLLRPTVDSVNKSSEAALQGKEVEAIEESKVAHTVAALPGSVHNINQQVNQVSSKVANAAIEFRARTAQAQAIVMTFLAPNAYKQKAMRPESDGRVPVAGVERSKMVEEVKKVEEQVTPARTAAASAEEQAAEDRVSWAETPRPAMPTGRRRHVAAH
jgi:cytoskeletal protein RodZ